MFISMQSCSMLKYLNKIPIRFNVAAMFFMATFVGYVVRVNISVSILAMVMPENVTNDSKPPDYGPRYDWDVHVQAHILGAFFWGYLTTSLVSGILAERYGGFRMILLALFVSSILTALSPIGASFGYWYLFAIRYTMGLVCAVLYPSLHSLLSKWAPPEEKGKFVATLLGSTIGVIVSWSTIGVIIETIGWIWSFYICAAFTFIITLTWWYNVSERPASHSRITETEKKYIESSIGDDIVHQKRFPPILKILTSIPFWGLLFGHLGNDWAAYFMMTVGPKYMNEILKFKLSSTGLLAAAPSLARFFFGIVFGQLGDYLRKRDILSVTSIRKVFTIFSHLIPALCLASITYVADPYMSIVVLTLSSCFNSANTITSGHNPQDLAPNFAGTLYAIPNFVGSTSGFISPLLVAFFTENNNTIEAWRNVFFVSASVYGCTGILFMLLSSGDIQSWNEIEQKEEKDKQTEAT